MTVRTSLPIVFEPGKDFFRTDRGITWGIKVSDINGNQSCMVMTKAGDAWVNEGILGDLLFIKEGETVKQWFVREVLPALNAWLARRFPALDENRELTKAEQLDVLILTGMRIVDGPGKTLKAEAI